MKFLLRWFHIGVISAVVKAFTFTLVKTSGYSHSWNFGMFGEVETFCILCGDPCCLAFAQSTDEIIMRMFIKKEKDS